MTCGNPENRSRSNSHANAKARSYTAKLTPQWRYPLPVRGPGHPPARALPEPEGTARPPPLGGNASVALTAGVLATARPRTAQRVGSARATRRLVLSARAPATRDDAATQSIRTKVQVPLGRRAVNESQAGIEEHAEAQGGRAGQRPHSKEWAALASPPPTHPAQARCGVLEPGPGGGGRRGGVVPRTHQGMQSTNTRDCRARHASEAQLRSRRPPAPL